MVSVQVKDVHPTILWHRDFYNFNLSLPRAQEEETVLSSHVLRIHSYAQIPSYFSSSNAWHEGLGKGCLRRERIEGTVTLSPLTVP